jgi:THO complex subunit 2
MSNTDDRFASLMQISRDDPSNSDDYFWVRLSAAESSALSVDPLTLQNEIHADHAMVNGLLLNADTNFIEAQRLSIGSWSRKELRTNTKITYQLPKSDLLAENLEGYARALSTLRMDSLTTSGRRHSKLIVESHTLMGLFKLNPLRVFDLVFDSVRELADSKHGDAFATSLESSTHLSDIIGFRLTRCADFKRRHKIAQFELQIAAEKENTEIGRLYPYLLPVDRSLYDKARSLQGVSPVDELYSDEPKFLFLESTGSKAGLLPIQASVERIIRLGCGTHALPKLRAKMCEQLKKRIHDEKEKHDENQKLESILRIVFFLGPNVCCDAALTTELLKYFQRVVANKREHLKLIEPAIAKCLLPGLPLLRPNPLICEYIWKVVHQLPLASRGKIYKHAMFVTCSTRLTQIKSSADKSIMRILRRLSNQNAKELGRKLGKLALCHPLTVTKAVLQQVQAYPNMIAPIVQALKYCTALTFDTLTFSVLEHFTETKSKLKEDGQNFSLWFSALCSFSGTLLRQYHDIELNDLLRYILKKLDEGEVLDLLILKDLISKLTGIEILKDVSSLEIQRMAAGEKLRGLHENSTSTDSKRRMKGILRLRTAIEGSDASKSMMLRLLLAIAKCRQRIVLKTASAQMKFLGQLFDECHVVLLQYISFLHTAYSVAELKNSLPEIQSLLCEHQLDAAVVFHLYRPILRQTLFSSLDTSSSLAESHNQYWKKLSRDVKASLHSDELWGLVSPEFYLTFWSLNLEDVYVPKELYAKARARTVKYGSTASSTFDQVTQLPSNVVHDELAESLNVELQQLIEHVSRGTQCILRKNSTWVQTADNLSPASVILETCVLPRCKISHADALYCSNFVELVGRSDTDSFSFIQYYDTLFRNVSYLIYACSEFENKFFATFLTSGMAQLTRWRACDVYKRECWQRSEFRNCLNQSSVEASFKDYLRVLYKWEHRLTKGILRNLQNEDYMEVANSLSSLIAIVDTFPVTELLGNYIYSQVKRISMRDKRNDIKTISNRYLSLLNLKRASWKCVPPEDDSASQS